ncbi:NADH:ubiquinone oxidoreductase subunit N, partial [Actinomyces sp. S6-Spd3]|uniref:NADH-quinone oxidoreductase subunit N n=2 Tax=Actinomycetales TaxID=2037 RepID=UPI00050F2657
LIALFVALEVLSLPLYILVATARRRRQLSQEAALKYFLLGAFASAFVLMGGALLYGFSGSVVLSEISVKVPMIPGMDWMLIVGVFMVMVGLLFKVGAAPFHAWTPDVYQGAPTPITGFMAAAVKVAAFATMVRIYLTIGVRLEWDLIWILAAVAALTIAIGTFVGLVQTDIKRLLAYSSIAHAGFVLIGV